MEFSRIYLQFPHYTISNSFELSGLGSVHSISNRRTSLVRCSEWLGDNLTILINYSIPKTDFMNSSVISIISMDLSSLITVSNIC